MLSLRKKLDDISFNSVDYQKIKSLIKNTVTRGSVLRSIAGFLGDFSTSYVRVSLHGIGMEDNVETRNYMEQYGIAEGLLLHNIKYLTVVYAIPLVLYGIHKLSGKFLKKNIDLSSDLILNTYAFGKWFMATNNLGLTISEKVPTNYSDLYHILFFSLTLFPMFYSLYESYRNDLGKVKEYFKRKLKNID